MKAMCFTGLPQSSTYILLCGVRASVGAFPAHREVQPAQASFFGHPVGTKKLPDKKLSDKNPAARQPGLTAPAVQKPAAPPLQAQVKASNSTLRCA